MLLLTWKYNEFSDNVVDTFYLSLHYELQLLVVNVVLNKDFRLNKYFRGLRLNMYYKVLQTRKIDYHIWSISFVYNGLFEHFLFVETYFLPRIFPRLLTLTISKTCRKFSMFLKNCTTIILSFSQSQVC